MIIQSWEELEKYIEITLFKLKVSHYSTDTPVEITEHFRSELAKLNDQYNKAKGLKKTRFLKRMLETRRAYWDYIKVFKDSQVLQHKQMYQDKAREFFMGFEAEIEKIKQRFQEAEGETKLGFGDCLVDAYLLYLDWVGETWQKSSSEYHSIFNQVITGLEAMKK